jgi:uncharacterized integral membrane protein (TIGR00697 family)
MTATANHDAPSSASSDRVRRDRYEMFFLVLAALFITSLVAGNLTFQKFFSLTIPLPWGGTYTFVQSVGLLSYPLTFLVTDLLSEVYGTRRAGQVVASGLVASLFTVLLVEVSDATRSVGFGTDDATFHAVFGASKIGVLASMVAYLAAQFLDVRLFLFWRRLTDGKHLWLRNNGSTMVSQTVDTFLVMGVLTAFGAAGLTWEAFPALVLNGLLFKWGFALLDTPLFYVGVGLCRRAFPEEMARVEVEELA